MASEEHELVQRFVSARDDVDQAVLEGYHAIKHALRFDATVHEIVVAEGTSSAELPAELGAASTSPLRVSEPVFDRLVARRPPVAVVARAARPVDRIAGVLREEATIGDVAPVILLEHPTHAGNLGAAVRVAAAAGAAGLATVGALDPWSPAALRGGAGLQYALPVGRLDDLSPISEGPRRLVVFDPDGEDLRRVTPPDGALLAFGTERAGISDDLRDRADHVVRIPMRPAVSSLNLATAVAVGLYAFTGPSVDV